MADPDLIMQLDQNTDTKTDPDPHEHHRSRNDSRGDRTEDEDVEGQGQDEVKEMAMVTLSLLKQDVKVMLQQVKHLVKANPQLACQVFTADVGGWTPVHACALRGKKKVFKVMMHAGIDVNARMGQPEGLPAGCTLLHIAANRQDKKIVDYLLHHGAEINARDSFGRTPLFYAKRVGNKEAAKLLMECGATVYSEVVAVNVTRPSSADRCGGCGGGGETGGGGVRGGRGREGEGRRASTGWGGGGEEKTSVSDDLMTPEPKLSRFCFLPVPQQNYHHHHHRHQQQHRQHHQQQQQQQQKGLHCQQQQQQHYQQRQHQRHHTSGHRSS